MKIILSFFAVLTLSLIGVLFRDKKAKTIYIIFGIGCIVLYLVGVILG